MARKNYFYIFARFLYDMVNTLNEYKIAYRGLKEGCHLFNFTLDRTFFDCFDGTKGTEGNVAVEVKFTKSALLMELRFDMKGSVEALCDRCLEGFQLNVQGEMEMFVKQGEREEGNDDDYIVLAADEDYLDLSSYLYEMYMLHYPIRAIHENGECNPEMEQVLGGYIIDEENKPTDPRWDALKKIINN